MISLKGKSLGEVSGDGKGKLKERGGEKKREMRETTTIASMRMNEKTGKST